MGSGRDDTESSKGISRGQRERPHSANMGLRYDNGRDMP